MRKKRNENTLAQVFEQMYATGRHGDKFAQAKLKSIWQSEMGDFIAQRTSRIIYSKGILTVYTESAPLKQELINSSRLIIIRLNRKAGKEIIKELKVF